jgi:signal transduction histidine kinase
LASILGPKQIFTLAVNIQNAAQNIILLIIGIISLKNDVTQARNFLIGFSLLLISAFAYEMRVVGILPGNFLTLHGLQIAAFFFALFIYFSLIDHIVYNREEKEKALANVIAIMQEKLIESQKVANLSIQLQELNLNLENTVEKRTKELTETNRKLIEVNHLKNEFIGIVVHDMKTPLIGIKLLADLILNKKLKKDKIKNLSDGIFKSSVHLLNSIQKMLDLNALEKGTVLKNVTTLDLRGLLAQSISLVRPIANEKKIQIQEINRGGFFEIETNQIALEKILENIISNSVKHSPPESIIKIKLFGISKKQNLVTGENVPYFRIVIQNKNIDFSKEKHTEFVEKEKVHDSRKSFTPTKGLQITQRLVKSIQCKIDVKITERYVVSTILIPRILS